MYYNRFAIIDAHYWWNVNHHSGQWSPEYLRQCRISEYYSPSRLANGPEGENSQAIYDQLCVRNNVCTCMHPSNRPDGEA